MKVKTAIKKLQELGAKDPKALVKIVKLPGKRVQKRKLSETLAIWARSRSKDGGSFTFLEACRYYEKIGGSAGAVTVRYRLEGIGARAQEGGLPDTHFNARWSLNKGVTSGPVSEAIAADPTFVERYERMRRETIERGGLAPAPFKQAVFTKSYSSKGNLFVEVEDPDRQRRLRLEVKPRLDYVPSTN